MAQLSWSSGKDDMARLDTRDGSIHGPPFLYEPSQFGFSFIWRWQATILPLVAASPLFWFLMLAHSGGIALYRYSDGNEPLLDWRAAVVPSGLLTFSLDTFGNQCYERYF